jgi:GT2 family glycosyltransferase
MLRLSIIITHHKTPELLKDCIGAIQRNINDIPSHIIVVDSQSSEKNQKMIENLFPGVMLLVSKENIGFGRSVNEGIKKAKGEYLLIMNADAIITGEKTIQEIITCLEENPQIGLLGPKLLNPDGTYQQSCFRFYTPATLLCRRTFLGKLLWGKRILNHFLMEDIFLQENPEGGKPIPVDWLTGSVLFTKRDMVKKVGPLDERFFMYFEDVDWCRRFWEAGFQVVYFPKVSIYHHHKRASKKGGGILDLFFSRYARIHLFSAVQYFLKYGLHVPSYGM